MSALEAACVRYPAAVPNDVLYLVAFVDAQRGRDDGSAKKRLEIQVAGVGLEDTIYFIGYYVVEVQPGGEIYDPDCEAKLEAVLNRTYRNEAGIEMKVFASGHDMGYEGEKKSGEHQPRVRDYCRKMQALGRNRIACKGYPDKTGLGTDWMWAINHLRTKKKEDNGHRWYFIDTLRTKDELAAKLSLGPRVGGIFFPPVAGKIPGYFAGLTSERRNPYGKGWKWEVKTNATANEPLDTMAGCLAIRDWVKASTTIFADVDKLIKSPLIKWQIPQVPTLITHPWDGDDMSAQAHEFRPSYDGMTPGGISEQAVQKMQRRAMANPNLAPKTPAANRPGGSARAIGPDPAMTGPTVNPYGQHGGGFGGGYGGGGPKTSGWGS
jgi:hypothetical protein